MSRDAVIVSTARTPLTKAGRGAFNNTTGATLGAFSIKAALERAGVEGGEVDTVVDRSLLEGYRIRLARLHNGWRQGLHGRGAGLLTTVVEDGFEAAIRTLVRGGLLMPAGGR